MISRAELRSALEGATGKGVKVLVVDTGVDAAHPIFRGREVRSFKVGTRRKRSELVPDEGGDAFGHGTGVAAILAEHAPGASIDSARVIDEGLTAQSALVLEALSLAIDAGYDVINCSFGTQNVQYLAGWKALVDRAFCENVLLVAACNNLDVERVQFPSAFPTVLSTDFGKLEGLSLERREGKLVEFIARGEDIRIAWKDGGFRTATGSSFAAAHLAALAARVRELFPSWNACQVKTALYELAG